MHSEHKAAQSLRDAYLCPGYVVTETSSRSKARGDALVSNGSLR